MKFIVTSIGTRGDMEPFLAIGEMLKTKGHETVGQKIKSENLSKELYQTLIQ